MRALNAQDNGTVETVLCNLMEYCNHERIDFDRELSAARAKRAARVAQEVALVKLKAELPAMMEALAQLVGGKVEETPQGDGSSYVISTSESVPVRCYLMGHQKEFTFIIAWPGGEAPRFFIDANVERTVEREIGYLSLPWDAPLESLAGAVMLKLVAPVKKYWMQLHAT